MSFSENIRLPNSCIHDSEESYREGQREREQIKLPGSIDRQHKSVFNYLNELPRNMHTLAEFTLVINRKSLLSDSNIEIRIQPLTNGRFSLNRKPCSVCGWEN